MKYFKQKTKTDCLLAAAENFTQMPRRKFGRLKWMNHNNSKFLRYESLGKILSSYNPAEIVFDGTVILENKPAILGQIYKANGETHCHALFWDGKNAYCPARGEFVDLAELDVCYVVIDKKHQVTSGRRYNNIKEIFKNWDTQCLSKDANRTKRVENLISLAHNGKFYPGDLKRVNTNIHEQIN